MELELVNKLNKLLPSSVISILIGKLLGDANLSFERNKRPRLRFSHKVQDREWCQHSRDQLASHISFPPIKYRKVKDIRLNSGYSELYYAQSHTHPALDILRQLWYQHGVKTIPFPLLIAHFTRISLAWWFMDDGHLKKVNDKPSKIILSTESFTSVELEELRTLLNYKFHLKFKVDKEKRLVLYNKMQIYYFLKLVQPYLVICMYRKTILKSPVNQTSTSQRTTIYLPIKLSNPTKQIHVALASLKEKNHFLCDDTNYIDFYSSVLRNIEMRNDINFSYQVTLSSNRMRDIHTCQVITGMRKSQVVHFCFLQT